jgi:hypothetical protein
MNDNEERIERDPFRWRSTVSIGLIAVVVLVIVRQYQAAIGVVLGGLLYAGNLVLMMEIGRSLSRQEAASRVKAIAALSSTGRLLFLGVALSAIALFLGRVVLLGACGGFLIAQVNLHILRPESRRRESRR